jgi:hemolysin activation/secretion protein
LPRQWQLQGRFTGQVTGDALIPGEQFGVAGANAVRGYLEREVIGDSGVAASVELYAPALVRALGSQQSTLQLLGFFDAGKVWNHLNTPCRGTQSVCPLGSFGVGLRAGLGTLQLRLDIAHALKDGNASAAGENRANVLATYVF